MNIIPNLEESTGIKGYLLNFKRIQGVIKHLPEDFIVREILPDGKVIFNGSEIGSDVGGMYTHFILWKRGLDTFSALKKIASVCHLQENDFGFAGLKDAQAVTLQRISVWGLQKNCLEKVEIPNVKIINPIRRKFSIGLGDLTGNQFQIAIRNLSESINEEIWLNFRGEAMDRGFLNFFGLQRFGSKRPILHHVGRYLLQQNYSDAIDVYLGNLSYYENEKLTGLRERYINHENPSSIMNEFPKSYSFERGMLKGLANKKSPERIILSLPQYFLRLAISAYQSYIFNITLQKLHKIRFPSLKETRIPLVGYSTDLSSLNEELAEILAECLENDDLDLTSFNHKHKKLRTKGTDRVAIVKPIDLRFNFSNSEKDPFQIIFNLTKGSYATMFLREVLQNKPIKDKTHSG